MLDPEQRLRGTERQSHDTEGPLGDTNRRLRNPERQLRDRERCQPGVNCTTASSHYAEPKSHGGSPTSSRRLNKSPSPLNRWVSDTELLESAANHCPSNQGNPTLTPLLALNQTQPLQISP